MYTIEKLPFEFVSMIEPDKTASGRVLEYIPENPFQEEEERVNYPFAGGPFCSFSIPTYEENGIYLLLVNERINYVGKCSHLSHLFNNGFGSIVLERSYIMNNLELCRINYKMLQAFFKGGSITLLFAQTAEDRNWTTFLAKRFLPEWNIPLYSSERFVIPDMPSSMVVKTRGKYGPLYDYLEGHGDDKVYLSFTEIQAILGTTLPLSAYRQSTWWSNDSSHAQAKAWLSAGFRIQSAYLGNYVIFERLTPA
ncbi:hypothetical protein ACFFGV_13075 [Pontibacillus salicampi]|uniref:DUF7662 domain-containing protein n=1 Tax=Pontibacillus salicampi TaxID=1449801 RepID=A0ABV6LQ17_9BACI